MKTYSEEFKAQIMAQMLPPTNRGIPELARETGIPKDTLYTWRGKQRMAVATTGRCQERCRFFSLYFETLPAPSEGLVCLG